MQLQQQPNNIKRIVIAVLLVFLVFIYKNYNPKDSNYFLKCPFLYTTGYKCAGCGSQRVVHSLLNFNLKEAFYYNSMMVLFIPYLILGAFLEWKKNKTPKQLKLQRKLYGTKAIIIVFFIVITFWIVRNTPYWPLN